MKINLLLYAFLFVMLLWCMGCNDNKRPYTKVDTLTDQNSIKDIVKEEVKSSRVIEKVTIAYKNLGWVQVAMIFMCVGGFILILLEQIKLGVAIICGGGLGNGLVAANIWHPELLAVVGVAIISIIGGGYALYRLYIWTKTTKAVVTGVENVKKILTPEQLVVVKEILGAEQKTFKQETSPIQNLVETLRNI